MNAGEVWRLRCEPSYYVRVENVTPRKVRYVVCNRIGQRKRGTAVGDMRTGTFLNAYEFYSLPCRGLHK